MQLENVKNEIGGRAQYIISSGSIVDEPTGVPLQQAEPGVHGAEPGAAPGHVPEDQLINHYLGKHSFSLTPSTGKISIVF